MNRKQLWLLLRGKAFETLPTIIDHTPPTDLPTPTPPTNRMHHVAFAHVTSMKQSPLDLSTEQNAGFKQETAGTGLGVIGKKGLANLTTTYSPKPNASGTSKLSKDGIHPKQKQSLWHALHAHLHPTKAPTGKSR